MTESEREMMRFLDMETPRRPGFLGILLWGKRPTPHKGSYALPAGKMLSRLEKKGLVRFVARSAEEFGWVLTGKGADAKNKIDFMACRAAIAGTELICTECGRGPSLADGDPHDGDPCRWAWRTGAGYMRCLGRLAIKDKLALEQAQAGRK